MFAQIAIRLFVFSEYFAEESNDFFWQFIDSIAEQDAEVYMNGTNIMRQIRLLLLLICLINVANNTLNNKSV